MPFDALVVLGCRVRSPGRLSDAAERRVLRATEAYRSGAAPEVVVSGGKLWHAISEAQAFAERLEQLGVPASAIVREEKSQSTVQNARFVAELARKRGLETLGIVSCDWHLPRALSAFQRHGLRVAGVAAAAPDRRFSASAIRWTSERLHAVADRVVVWVEGAW